jgi:hypothetical protein
MLRYKVYLPESFGFLSNRVFWHGFSQNRGRLKLQNANKPIPIPSGAYKGSAHKIILYTIKTFDNDKH